MNKKSLLIAAVAILVIAIIGITYLLFTEKQACLLYTSDAADE